MSYALPKLTTFISTSLIIGLAMSLPAKADEEQRIAALINSQQWQEAQVALDQWQPQDPNAKHFLQQRLQSAQKPGLAIKQLKRFIQQSPEYPEAYNNLAVELIDQGEYKQASEWLVKGIATDGRYQQLHENLSRLYTLMASQAYQKALGNTPSTSKASEFGRFEYLQPRTKTSVAVSTTTAKIKPLPPTPTKVDRALLKKQLVQQLRNWADAWSSQKVENYLSFYSDAFRPSDGMALEEWRQIRRERVSAPRFIRVTVSKPDVTLFADGSIASIRFMQHYRSNTFDERIVKFMIWGQQQGEWRILQEETGV